jgi:hypothetical protein
MFTCVFTWTGGAPACPLVPSPPLPCGDHRPLCLVVLLLAAELPSGRVAHGPAWHRGHPRDSRRWCRAAAAQIADSPTPIAYAAITSEGVVRSPGPGLASLGAPALYSTISLEAPVGSGSPILPRPGRFLCTAGAFVGGVQKTGRRPSLFVLLILPVGLLVLEPVLVRLAVGHGGAFEGGGLLL